MIHLKRVSVDNWYACTQLDVTEEQRKSFPAPVVYWIAESKVVTDFRPMAIYLIRIWLVLLCTQISQIMRITTGFLL